jgi:hypothetical protein
MLHYSINFIDHASEETYLIVSMIRIFLIFTINIFLSVISATTPVARMGLDTSSKK